MIGAAWLCVAVSLSMCWLSVHCSIDCSTIIPTTQKSRLQKDIICGYDPSQRPPSVGNKIKVNLLMFLRHLSMDEEEKILDVHLSTYVRWKDSRLKWNPEDYRNIQYITVEGTTIWKPEIGLVTLRKTIHSLYIPESLCSIFSNGVVECGLWVSFHTPCQSDITYWPYDSHVCEALLAAWNEDELVPYQDRIQDQQMYKENREWNLIDSKVKEHNYTTGNKTYQFLEIQFNLSRFSSTYEAVIVVPALILFLTILASTWIELNKSTRLCLVSTVLVCQIFSLQYLRFSLHSNDGECPLIVLFYRDSMATTGISLITILATRFITSSNKPPPEWIKRIVSMIQQNELGNCIIHFHGTKRVPVVADGEDVAKQIWQTFGTLIDRLTFLVNSVVMFILIILYFKF